MAGIFYGIGVGPGDPELLTLKAVSVIREADVIIAPKTEKKEDSVALSIAAPYVKENVQIVKLVFPMVSDSDTLSEAWEYNKNVIVDLLKAGKKVIFLTLGDPMFYSTYIYVFRLLENCGYPIETIPGVPAFCAIGSKLGYPLVEGNDILSIIPATASPEKVDKALSITDNVVLMKVYKNVNDIVDKLHKYNLSGQAVMISRCGLPEEEVVCDLDSLKGRKINYLSTILSRRG
ncbi:precorrin-2 C(20)-methyltransferase [Propionispora vibrioides]|uniref:Precorrin-2/cobalt-factor-2 C20-methyltransferase n=1 Tax=Propionispora vibrioides TaxID=112903 RepID=A0A1H8X5N8_9FIRM|nr:precorrin-2 C(20)-methyltransferase [Propionispora vibrioides]SEP35240.1 precorrin-2/cobalt-factor-2 C20-methyltransferase [Propionispora vibrioides]